MIRQRLLTGTASNYVGKAVSVGTWLVLTPFVLARLGDATFALWVLMGAITSYGFLLDLGIGGAVVKYVAEHTARGERGAARSFIASAAWLYLGLAIVAIALGLAAAPLLPGLLGVSPEQHLTASWLVAITAVNVALTIAFAPSFAVLKGLQRYDLYNAVVVGSYLGEAAGVVTVLLAGGGVLGMVGVLAAVNLATGAGCALVVRHVAPDLAISWRGAEWRVMRQIGSFSASLFAIDVAIRLQTKTDEFVIAALRMLPLVTPYALARKLAELGQLICVPFLKVVMPLASSLDANDEGARLRMLYIVSSRIALAVAVPITLGLAMLGGPILTLWVGAAYAQYAPVLTILAVASLVATSQWPAVEILQGMARHRRVALTSLAAGIANVALSVVLLPRLGLIGVALGTLIPAIIAWIGIILPFALRTLRVSPFVALRDVWAPSLIPGAAAALVLRTIAGAPTAPSVVTIVGTLAGAAAVYMAAYLLMPAAAPERRLIADILAIGTRRLKQLRTEASGG